MRVVGLSIIAILLLALAVSAVDVDPQLINELEKNSTARVIIKLKDPVASVPQPAARSFLNSRSLRTAAIADNLEVRKQKIQQAQEKVLSKVEEGDFQLKHKLENSNVLTGELTAEGLADLDANEIESITLDVPVSINLADSVPLINGNLVHNLQVNGISMTGAGQTICVIDTGIDYTHPVLSGCNPITYNFTGTPELLETPVESDHPYADNTDVTFKINKTGYSNIALHFVNLSLENKGTYDTTDRVIIYDQYNQTIAIYNGSENDFWTPYAEGDTIYLRLISDGSVIDYGFYIDQIADGTTNTTVDWSSCPNIEGGWDAYNSDNDPMDDNGHGTHVAGILISNDATYTGVAPAAHLAVVKALNYNGSGYLSDINYAIDWCTSKKELYNISVISMSVGTGATYNSGCDSIYSATADAINNAVAKNISVVIASGNDAVSNGISAPACITNATSVGATTKGDAIASYSNGGDILDLLAPGDSITSTKLGGNFIAMSGTSMATPHVAAAFALLNQYWQEVYHAEITPAEALNKFKLTGKEILDSRNDLYFPRIDLLKAVQPIISFTNSSITNATSTTANSALINVTSDVPLTSAILELAYPNNTKQNLTLQANNQTNFQTTLSLNDYGDYSYVVYGNDSVTLGLSAVRTLTRINIITVNYPSSNSYHNSAFDLNISLSSHNLTSSSYVISNQSGATIQENHNLSINQDQFNWYDLIDLSNSTFVDGNYTLSVEAYNAAGESDSVSIDFIVDKTPPNISFLNITPSLIYRTSNITFFVNIYDSNLDPSTVYFSSDYTGFSKNYSLNSTPENFYSHTLNDSANLSPGENVTYLFYAVDLAGNTGSTETFYFIVADHVPNNATIITPNTTLEVGVAVSFNATAVDVDNDLLTYIWNFGDGTTSDDQNPSHAYYHTGNYNLTLNVSDTIAQNSTSLQIVVTDTTPPILENISYLQEFHLERDVGQNISSKIFDYSGISTVNLVSNFTANHSCTLNSTTSFCSFIKGNLTLGTYQFYLNFSDNFSNRDQSSNYSFTVTSCFDQNKNGDESGVDCGGSCSLACPVDNPEESAPTDGSSSGGGGGGGSSSTAGQENIAAASGNSIENSEEASSPIEESLPSPEEQSSHDNVAHEFPLNLIKGEFVDLQLDYPDLPIKGLSLKAKEDLPATIKFNTYDETPTEVLPLKNVFKYIEITPDVDNDKISSANLLFTVPREWLENNNFVAASVKLQVFEEGQWKDVKTKEPSKDALTGGVIAADSSNVYYQANLPHFSFYAITADTEAPAKWYQKIIPKHFSTQEYFLAGMLIFIVVLLVAYLLVKDREE